MSFIWIRGFEFGDVKFGLRRRGGGGFWGGDFLCAFLVYVVYFVEFLLFGG